jgi:putative acetyltransferase
MFVRDYQPADAYQIVHLFFNTIHLINRQDYTEAQVNAWAPYVPEPAHWQKRSLSRQIFVADEEGTIVGFAEFETNGHIDCFYCHHAYQGRGVGRQLLQRIEQEARSLHLPQLFTEASITAQPFFLRMGFHTLQMNRLIRRGVELTNFSMAKELHDSGVLEGST